MSEGFSADWLALREPADDRARCAALLAGLSASPEAVLSIVDLGAGTGANLRWLAPRLAACGWSTQEWTCADHDPALRAALPERCAAWSAATGAGFRADSAGFTLTGATWRAEAQTLGIDLASGLNGLALPAGGLVSASALLDLVSAAWLEALLARACARHCRLLFALTYDGRCTLTPAHADDPRLVALVNRHQRGDKGFGPALGPAAAAQTARRCTALGYRVHTAPSDWQIGAEAPALQQALLAGWCAAALAIDPAAAPWLHPWRVLREQQCAAGLLHIHVGHQDLLALPGT